MRRIIPLVFVGCVGDQPSLSVHVTDATGAAIEGATVAAVCDMPGNGGADVTDADGLAVLTLWYETGDTPCTVTVSRADRRTKRLVDVPPCLPDHACATLEVALEAR